MPEISPSKYLVQATWDDVPHLDEQTKKELMAGTPPHLREARAYGAPSLGSGAIYPIPVSEITTQPFPIPPYWKRCFGLDVGWSNTAALWIAEDPTDKTRYAYAEHTRGEALPLIHAEAIKARGAWIPGAVDPASRGRGQADGRRLFTEYAGTKDEGGLELNLHLAINDVEAGLYKVWTDLTLGRLKVFSSLVKLLAEYRIYRRDEKGHVVKKNDHLMDALRYAHMTFDKIAMVRPAILTDYKHIPAADKLAGY